VFKVVDLTVGDEKKVPSIQSERPMNSGKFASFEIFSFSLYLPRTRAFKESSKQN
jgi:hypothetical protein